MSCSSRPRTRGQVAEHMKNVHSDLKRKRQGSNSVGSEKSSSVIKESLNLGENARKDECSVKKTRNACVKSSFSEGNGRKGKVKSDSNVCFVDRVVRKKAQLDLSDMSENDDDNVGFEFVGEKVVINGREFLKKSGEKKGSVTICEIPSGCENVEKDEIFMEKGVESGRNRGNKCSVASGNAKKKGKEKKYSNVVSLDISDRNKDDDVIESLSNGSSSGFENMEKDEIFIKKGVESGKNGGKNCSVSNVNAKKKGKEKCSNVCSLDKVLKRRNQLDISDGSGDDDDGIVFLDGMIDITDSSLSAISVDMEESDGFEFCGEKVTGGSTSSDSREDDEDIDAGFEVSGEGIVASGSSSKDNEENDKFEFLGEKVSSGSNSSDSSEDDEDTNDELPQNDDFVGLEVSTSDSEILGGDSDGLVDQSDDSSMCELVSSSEEEEDEDDYDVEFNENEPSSSDDSLCIPYSSSDDNDVEYVSERDNETGGEAENKKNDAFVEKTLRSGKKIKRMESLSDYKDVEYFSDRNIGKNEKNENKDKGVFMEKICRSRKKIKRMNSKKENDAGINEGYRSDKGNSAENGLRKKKVPGIETSKSRKKDPQCGKSTWPPPIIERDECSGEKKLSSKEVVMNLGMKISRSARNADLIRILNSLNEGNINVEECGFFKESLPLKFRFEDEVDPPPEKSEQEKEIDSLFLEMKMCYRVSEMESANFDKMESGISSNQVDESPEACCGRGEHHPILDEQIGIMCRFCGAIILEIKDILPPWYTPRSRRQQRKYFDESLSFVHGEFQFHDSANVPTESFSRAEGTVWDLIPGIETDMFPHQREGFEFLWKKLAGDIAIEKLPEELSDEGRGGIISHAPGTGKTRLAVVFLLSFLKRYPNARPVIIAPSVILATWEKEFVKWYDLSFHNMNNPKLSGSETRFGGGTRVEGVRIAKLLSWMAGGGVLGISYTLFASLSSKGEKGREERAIWETLVKQPGLLVLDEGHTPRNGNSLILKAIKKVRTKQCIILSGTPFQNNFEELKHMLCLVNPSFHEMDNSSWKGLTEGKDELEELRSMLEPYVHLHEGSVLQKSLFGLKRVTIDLCPTELQKELMNDAMKEKNLLTRTHLVSRISVHPSVLMLDKTKKFINSRTFSSHKDKLQEIESNIDEGVKIKFVMNLIQLADALGERVLVFSLYIDPLIFIKEQLKTHFSWSEGKEVLYMNGSLSEKQRQMCISLLNNDLSEAKVLLAAERACSEGISLVGASRVVLLDTVWNPSVETQAISRAYRLGQKKTVYVYRLITCGMEVRQYEQQARKVYISKSIFSRVDGQAGEIETSNEVLEDKFLEQMLNLETLRNIFDKIVPEESDFSESFRFTDL